LASAPRISVIIPVFCGAETIKRALDSVAVQTFADLEIIVVDDGSTDRTAEIVRQSSQAGLKLIQHGQNRGAAAARNTGIAAAQGRWIAFLDSDDSWRPDKLAHQVAMMERAASNVMACSTGYYLHKDGRELTVSLNLSPEQFRREILFGCTISPGTTLFVERRVFDEFGFDEDMRRLEDWDWLLRFAKRYDVAFVAQPLADVYLTTRRPCQTPDRADPVLDAIQHIRAKHLPCMESPKRRRQLRSSLLVETAATLYRRGRPLPAAVYVIAAFFVYPVRNAAYFRTLWRSVIGLFQS